MVSGATIGTEIEPPLLYLDYAAAAAKYPGHRTCVSFVNDVLGDNKN